MFSAYRGTWWNNIAIHQKVLKETNEESISSTLILVILQSIDWIKLNLLPLDTYQKKFWYVQAVAGGFRQSPFFNKIAGLRPATLLKKRLWHKCFPVNFAKFLRTPFLQNTSWRLVLKVYYISLVVIKTLMRYLCFWWQTLIISKDLCTCSTSYYAPKFRNHFNNFLKNLRKLYS